MTNSIDILCSRETFHQIKSTFRADGDLSNSINFRSARRPSVNFPCGQEAFRQFLSTFSAFGRPVNF